jgi:ABC-type transport system involved in Fe-S cluster assembly fused permease/ATPase subunit
LGTIRGYDKVLILEGGRVVEEGELGGLIGMGGAFMGLWERHRR